MKSSFIKEKINNPFVLAILTLFVSISLAIYMIGLSRINIYNITWITGDMAQVFTAWGQFFSENHSFFDLTTNRLSYPLDISIALFDPMPILVQLAKPFVNFFFFFTQYIGIYLALCIILQGYFGFLVIWYSIQGQNFKVKDNFLISLFGSLFFMFAPYTLARMQGHIALSSQWLLVLGILLNIKFYISSKYKNTFLHALFLFVVAGFNPYLAIMALLTPFSILLISFIKNKLILYSFLLLV